MSVASSIISAVKGLESKTSFQELINKTSGDYNEVSLHAFRNTLSGDRLRGNNRLLVGGKKFETKNQVVSYLNKANASISPKIQKALGQKSSDTNIDDFDDALKVLGAGNVFIVPENYSISTTEKTKEKVKNTVKSSSLPVKSIALVLAGFGVLGALILGVRK